MVDSYVKTKHIHISSLKISDYESIDTWLFDCDGVLYKGNTAVNGSKELLKRLQMEEKRIFFITNNSLRSRREVCDKLRSIGICCKEEAIITTASIAAQYLKNQNFCGKVYLMGSPGMAAELDSLGISHIGLGPDPVTSTDLEYFTSTELDPEVKCVLVGIDHHVSYRKMLKAASYIKNKEALFLGTNEDTCLPLANANVTIPGTGSLVRSIAVASDTTPVVVGKPSALMFETLRQTFDLNPATTVIVGDSLHTDILMGQRCCIQTILVLTGIHSLDDALKLPKEEQPHFVMPSVKEIADLV